MAEGERRGAQKAALVAWLPEPESGVLTGAELVADGGIMRKTIHAE